MNLNLSIDTNGGLKSYFCGLSEYPTCMALARLARLGLTAQNVSVTIRKGHEPSVHLLAKQALSSPPAPSVSIHSEEATQLP